MTASRISKKYTEFTVDSRCPSSMQALLHRFIPDGDEHLPQRVVRQVEVHLQLDIQGNDGNLRSSEIDHLLKTANLLLDERIMCDKYGLRDSSRLAEGISNIAASFCNRTFRNMMPLVIEILDSMTKKYELEKETICVTFGRSLSQRTCRSLQIHERDSRPQYDMSLC